MIKQNFHGCPGFELRLIMIENYDLFCIITMPKKSDFSIFTIQNFVQNIFLQELQEKETQKD